VLRGGITLKNLDSEVGHQRALPRRCLLKPQRQICIATSWATGIVWLFVLLGICGISCRGAAPEVTPVEWVADGIITAGEYAGRADYGDYEVHWNSDERYVYIGMEAKTGGWVAVGFQPQPLHRETDMVLGLVRDGEASIFDMFSSGDLGPCVADSELGGSDDIAEFNGREEGGYTTIEFKRLLSTGDEYDGELFSETNEIIWAYSASDDTRQKHFERGRGEIEL
jgi:hypothetical protein